MGRPSTDIILRSFFTFCIQDLRRNPWLLTDVFALDDLEDDALSKVENGEKEYRNAYDFFQNNNISVVLKYRMDRAPTFPAISIELNSSSEHIPVTTLGDVQGISEGTFDPSDADIDIVKTYNNFNPLSYDPTSGTVTFPTNITTNKLGNGTHILLEKATGRSFLIDKVVSANQFQIPVGSQLSLKDVYIQPASYLWNQYLERSRIMESYTIGCHASSNSYECIWLTQLIEYCVLKYKSKFLDSRNFQLSTFSISDISKREEYQGDNIYSRYMTLSGQSEMNWIKEVSPRLARVNQGILIDDAPKTPPYLYTEKQGEIWRPELDGNPPPDLNDTSVPFLGDGNVGDDTPGDDYDA